jgi:hypothetical protein
MAIMGGANTITAGTVNTTAIFAIMIATVTNADDRTHSGCSFGWDWQTHRQARELRHFDIGIDRRLGVRSEHPSPDLARVETTFFCAAGHDRS